MREVIIDSILIVIVMVAAYYAYVLILRQLQGKSTKKSYVKWRPFDTTKLKGEVDLMLEIPEEIEFRLDLLDLDNKVVLRIYDGKPTPGQFVTSLDTKQAPDGVYFCMLESAIQKESRRIEIYNA